ncbi:MAG TPA: M36 family metallopeptidase [Kofleriaceae bacterium]|nr:M36 family metallopeptidase [Kofleriaceae bacterium]
MSPRSPLLTTLACLLPLACSSSGDEAASSPPPASPSNRVTLAPINRTIAGAASTRMFLALGRDPSPPSAATTAERARAHLARHAAALGAAPSDLAGLDVVREIRAPGGGTVTTFRPAVDGVPVVDHDTRVLTRGDGSLALISGLPRTPAARPRFVLSAADAFARALRAELGKNLSAASVVDRGALGNGWRAFGASGVKLLEPSRARPVIAPSGDDLVAAYQVEVLRSDRGGAIGTEYRIDAATGAIIRKRSLNQDASFQYRVYADAEDKRPNDGALADVTPHPTGEPDLLVRDPAPSRLVTMEAFNEPNDPWLPEGARTTRGNNVHAYADLQGADGLDAGDIRDIRSAPGVFDWSYNTNLEPLANARQTRAVTTHLFYVNNWLHDWWYDSGFDEAAGNAQQDNFGRGGVDGDPLLAEAQDAALQGVRDNANMMTPEDGSSPRMQMYVFTNQDARQMTIEPSGERIGVVLANFGPQSFNVAGEVRAASPASGCTAIGNVAGRIALINAGGTCSNEDKVRRAQAGGAIAAIIAHNRAGELPVDLEDTGATNPTIPSFGIRREAGDDLRAQMAEGPVTLRLRRGPGVEKDSSLDTAIIAHEWGHYMHLRLQGCGTAMCYAQSEGWGDFLSLHTLMREGEDPDGTYGVGHFAITDFDRLYGNGDAAYFGIRRAPYTRDMSKNGFSFRHIQDGEPLPDHIMFQLGGPNNEVHNAGEIWTIMLFEAYQALIDRSRDGDYSFDDARRRMTDYIVAGLAAAPSDSTYLEARDAILAAAAAADMDDAVAMAEGFARRGAGSCAISPPSDSFDFVGVEESFDNAPRLVVGGVVLDDSLGSCDGDGQLDSEETGLIRVTVVNPGTAALGDGQVTLSNLSAGLVLPEGDSKEVPSIPAFGSVEVTFKVKLDPPTTEMVEGSVDVNVTARSSCEQAVATVLATRLNFNVVPNASLVDDVETEVTAWVFEGDDGIWTRAQKNNGNHVWHAADPNATSDGQMISPAVTVADRGPLVLTFAHRYAFEETWDGGVIEYTTDGGETWQDVSDLGVDPGYTGILNQSDNPIGGRNAYTGQIASWPRPQQVSLDLGTSLAGQTVQFRFHSGSDAIIGGEGWEVDNIGFEGVVDPPFPAMEADTECEDVPEPDAGPSVGPDGGGGGGDDGDGADGGDGDDDGGCGCHAGDGSPAAGGLLLVLALVPFVRRRRRGA